MPRRIVMPVMGMYTDEGVLTSWLRPAGEHVEAGEAVAEVTTEKTTFEVPAPACGILHPVAEVGTNLRVEALMGYILAEGETLSTAESPQVLSTSEDQDVPRKQYAPPGKVRPAASPAARRLAYEHGIDLSRITGTGPSGRIVEADVRARVVPASADRRVLRKVPMAGFRQIVAEHLRSTLAAAASTTLTREVDADGLVAARQRLAGITGGPPSYSALFIKLLAWALRDFPELNAAVEDDSIVIFDDINIGFAVATPRGLVVPVIHHADSARLVDIAHAVRDLTERTLAGRLRPTDVQGGTASITNLGSHGIDAFTPILDGPQSVILGIGRIAERAVVRAGTLAVGHTCVLSLTFDHRVADGVPAARLLDAIVRRMNSEFDPA